MSFQLSDISKYRSSIMGFAMIWVVLYHYQFEGIIRYPFGFGFTGVDLFMLCSGLGLFYSYDKNPNTALFYRKRLLRIFPTYYAIGLVVSLINGNFSLTEYLWKYSTLGFWTDGIYIDWFIPGIILLYLLFPFIYNTLFKSGVLDKKVLTIVLAILFFFIIYSTFLNTSLMDVNHYLILYRIPVFILGTLIAFGIKNGWNTRWFILLSIILLPFFSIFYLRTILPVTTIHLRYLPTAFIAPFLIFVLCIIFKYVRIGNLNILGGVGNASLEIYLFHMIVAKLFKIWGITIVNYK